VLQQRGPGDGLEIRVLSDQEIPVRDIDERCGDVLAQPGDLGREHDQRKEQDAGKEQPERRQEAARAPEPEPSQVQAAGGCELGQQEAGDQVPADHEEDVDAQESTRQDVGTEVVGEHRQDGQGAQAIEAGQVRQRA